MGHRGNPYHDKRGRFTSKGNAAIGSASSGARPPVRSSANPEHPLLGGDTGASHQVGDSVRNKYRLPGSKGNRGVVDELQAGGDVVVVKWNDGTWSQEDPTTLVRDGGRRRGKR